MKTLMKTPNPKLQNPKNLQIPISNCAARKVDLAFGVSLSFGIWFLRFVEWDFFGGWNLGFEILLLRPQ
jgi:hypothetical protein